MANTENQKQNKEHPYLKMPYFWTFCVQEKNSLAYLEGPIYNPDLRFAKVIAGNIIFDTDGEAIMKRRGMGWRWFPYIYIPLLSYHNQFWVPSWELSLNLYISENTEHKT